MGARKKPTPPNEVPKRGGRAIAPVAAAPHGLPALFERAASAANFDVEALGKLIALKREMEAFDDRRAFDQDFAALQAEIGRVEANAYNPDKRQAYADINALDDAVRTSISAKGFALSFDTASGAVPGSITVTATLTRRLLTLVLSRCPDGWGGPQGEPEHVSGPGVRRDLHLRTPHGAHGALQPHRRRLQTQNPGQRNAARAAPARGSIGRVTADRGRARQARQVSARAWRTGRCGA